MIIICIIAVVLYDLFGLYGIMMTLERKGEIIYNLIGLAIPNIILIIAMISKG
jgi:hypothetical protein